MVIDLILVRHGESKWNAQARIQGQHSAESPLTDKGRRESIEAGNIIRKTANKGDIQIDKMLASDLVRVVQSAEIIYPIIAAQDGGFMFDLQFDSRLRERGLGKIEGELQDEIHQKFGVAEWDGSIYHVADFSELGFEPLADIYGKRVAPFFEEHIYPKTKGGVLVVASGWINSYMANFVLTDGKMPQKIEFYPQVNGTFHRFKLAGKKVLDAKLKIGRVGVV